MESGKKSSRHPQEEANFVSRLFLWWIFPLLWKGWRRPLQQDDLYEVRDKDQSCKLTKRLEEKWEQEKEAAKRDKRASKLWKVMLQYFDTQDYMMYIVIYLATAVGQNISWYSLISLLKLVSEFCFGEIENNISFYEDALVYVYGVMLGFLMEAFALARFNLHGAILGNKAKSGVMGLLYKKVLRLNKRAINSGHVMELLCNDSQRLATSGEWFIPIAFRHILYIINIIVWLLYFIGWQIIPGALFLVFPVVLQMLCSRVDYRLRRRASELSEKRLGYIRESLTVIHSVKVNCWEKIFEEKIQKTRWEEVKLKCKRWTISLMCYAFRVCGQSLATFIAVCTLIYTARNEIAYLNFFSMIYLFGILNTSVAISLPTSIRLFTDVRGALQRIEMFLKATDNSSGKSLQSAKNWIKENGNENLVDLAKQSKPYHVPFVHLCDVTCEAHSACSSFQFSEPKTKDSTLLKNITLEVSTPALVLICGAVGSGKSSLLEAILGELLVTNGSVNYFGKLAYVSDTPWVFPGTIRENIVFGLPYNESKYNKILEACQLVKDFDNFPEHDLTRIGENSATVSGGQRTRIALARAVYSEADIYLLDDPLSSLDINVAENVFRDCIQGLLSDRIVLLTTHATKHYPMADHIVQLGEGGVIAFQGNFETFKTTLSLDESVEDDANLKDGMQREVWADNKESVEGVNLQNEEETRERGTVSWKVYLKYLLHGASPFLLLLVPVLLFSGAGLIVLVDFNASRIPKIAGDENSRFQQMFLLYIIYIIFAVLLTFAGTLSFFLLLMNSSYKIHNKMVTCLMKAPLSFYARNPVGRILNRLSQDINILDEFLPFYAYVTFTYISPVVATILLASITNPWLILSFLLSMPVFYFVASVYINSSTDIKRLMLILAGPVYSHFSNTMEGLKTIRIHSRQKEYTEEVFRHIDKHSAAVLSFYTATRCFGPICCGLTTFVAGIVTVVVIFTINDPHTATLGAITILYALQTNTFVKISVRFAADINTQMTSAERTLAFTQIPPERGQSLPKSPPMEWPNAGALEFQGVSLWHYKGGPKVLKNISFKVKAKEKIGIAGRTGAGKSSLVAALMRLAFTEGDIFVDGLNIREINVVSSRQVISVISQAPILINGTIRVNLDPVGEHSDSEIWQALAQTKMTSAISNLPRKLQNEVTSSDSNFSLGERQLLHLTRVLLKKNKIIIFDEATGKVDRKTDEDIQNVVREVFKDCTVITIAHRLSTILDSDRIMILDQGKIVDCGTPQSLLNKEGSLLKQLLELSSEN